jgi:Ca2+-binding RTX toxin-like protein
VRIETSVGLLLPLITTNDPRCVFNPLFNDVVCDVAPTRIVVNGSEAVDGVAIGGSNGDCPPGPPIEAIITLNGGDDRMVDAGRCPDDDPGRLTARFTARGRPGNDLLTGGLLKDVLDGGSGNDELRGEEGDDQLTGGFETDVIDGGPGRDSVTFNTSFNQVVTLDGTANDGEAGEGDNYLSIERVIGGRGNDILVGSAADEQLAGGDRDDEVTGGLGTDSLSFGNGDDVIDARDGTANDTVSCGAGEDEAIVDLIDTVLVSGGFLSPRPRSRLPECERVERFAIDDGPPARAVAGRRLRIARDGSVGVRVACPRTARVACRGRLSLADPRRPGRALAAAAYDIRLGRTAVVGLELRAGEATRLRARGAVAALTRERGASKRGPRSSLQVLVVR